ncbi:hypothetical protein [[Phormidium] sp. ETS-05]|uniref:hypothetical protein n=1 Tax=[Phormidium] sp. ETS-05 TaxID=222819 RepID=UPI0018EEE637|nr:hypothetical protein [[Phormidium] sp. ETS-05]
MAIFPMKLTKSIYILTAVLTAAVFLQSCNNAATKIEDKPTASVAETTVAPSPEPPPDPLASFDMQRAAKLTATARLLAGMSVATSDMPKNTAPPEKVAAVEKTAGWKEQNSFFDNSWKQLEAEQITPVRKWSETELQTINASNPQVFYPFSGPDFLYVYSLFPDAKEYVMVGLEPVGTLPDFEQLNSAQINQQLANAKDSLDAILKFSFFRTKDMAVDLSKQGVLPVLLLFAARTNNQILDVQYVGIDKQGDIQMRDPSKEADKSLIPGVKISFVPQGKSNPRTAYYFSTDLSDSGLEKTPEFLAFVKKMDKPVTYLKAASYLMHYSYFGKIRDGILAQSSHLLQDDSGIPYRNFDKSKWEMNFYGNYIGTIPLFADFYQADLREVYKSGTNVKKIDFGIGYKYYEGSHLMLMNAKAPGETPQPEATTTPAPATP